jgi:hypothetical protein
MMMESKMSKNKSLDRMNKETARAIAHVKLLNKLYQQQTQKKKSK